MKLGQNKKQKSAQKIYLICCLHLLFWLYFLLGCLKATKSPKIASHGSVRVPSRAVRLFPALLALIRPSYGHFPNSFAMKAREGAYGPYDKCIYCSNADSKEHTFINCTESVKLYSQIISWFNLCQDTAITL